MSGMQQEQDWGKAEELTDTLLKRIDDEAPSESFTYEIETADIEGTVDRFSQMFRFAQRFGEPMPCFDFGEYGKAPIDFLPQWPSPAQFYEFRFPEIHFFLHSWVHELRSRSEEQSGRIELFNAGEARSFFRDGLLKFLFSRFKNWGTTGGGSSPSKGIAFDVYTQHNGQRVHYTYSHLINTSPVFGAPTKHVSGYIKPGVWKFGVWKGGGVVLDPADFDVPAVNEAHLVV